MSAMSTLFISHGSPMLALQDHATTRAWSAMAAAQPRPRAVLVASAHYLTAAPAVGAAERPATGHDFGGFPAPLYQLQYPAPGAPALAARVAELLAAAGLPAQLEPQRGLDHGIWVPLRRFWPQAEVPVIPLALQPRRDAAYHLQLGRALRPLLDEEVLIIGSGNLTHNLYELQIGEDEHTASYAREFSDWMAQRLHAHDDAALAEYRSRAPQAARAHPSDEHLLPLFVAYGAAGTEAQVERVYDAVTDGVLAMDCYRFTPAH
ncbi:Aromatic ring-opening dioxygenase, catalytic subunit, LigB family [Solimonas aquatica]|uniref:Aromatic ring-opening dioxygenase, catalytic subunit, LigB family n=1 Tax=Solimonas aquatica TaxID=489703 RepID=A0A1H9MAL1_9GAMM|nr:class III extradiol ring-cleavage dioxygenase [Solimonas aquatica]SER20509.1 Aromatic ring-opening dioxygenase, catalytic subunit, LigB family [Solimonas aquatica]